MKKRTEISQKIFQLNMKSRPPIWIHMWLDSLLCSHVMQQIFCWANLQWNCPWGQKHVETQRDRGAKLTRTTSWLVSQGVPPIPEEWLFSSVIFKKSNILYFNFGYKYDWQIQIVAIFRKKDFWKFSKWPILRNSIFLRF